MASVDVEVSLYLPYRLALPAADYPTSAAGGSVSLSEAGRPAPAIGGETTRAASTFTADEAAGPDAVATVQLREADRLLRRVNHLLRWYRVTADQPNVAEVTRAQVGRFMFSVAGGRGDSAWATTGDLVYEAPRPSRVTVVPAAQLQNSCRAGLATGAEPDVATLNLLDAEYALSVGRFREAVLLCWSVIDSTFTRTFDRLVDAALPDEWPDGRRFLKGFDFGLRQKMTSGLRLVAGRSLYAEPGEYWARLSASYGLRNAIIHAGQLATEDQAAQAIAVAKRMVAITAELRAALPPLSSSAAP